MKVLDPNFKLPENPCEGCSSVPSLSDPGGSCIDACDLKMSYYVKLQSILSQLKEVELNKTFAEYTKGNITLERLAEIIGVNFYTLHSAFLNFKGRIGE